MATQIKSSYDVMLTAKDKTFRYASLDEMEINPRLENLYIKGNGKDIFVRTEFEPVNISGPTSNTTFKIGGFVNLNTTGANNTIILSPLFHSTYNINAGRADNLIVNGAYEPSPGYANRLDLKWTGTGANITLAEPSLAFGSSIIAGGSGYSTVNTGTNANVKLGGQHNTINYNFGYGLNDSSFAHFSNTIETGSGYANVNVSSYGRYADLTVKIGGYSNIVSIDAYNSEPTADEFILITGGLGKGDFFLTGKTTLITGGYDNDIRISGVSDEPLALTTFDAGSGHDTATVIGGRFDGTFHGAANEIYLSSNAYGTIHDDSRGLEVHIGSMTGNIDILNFGANRGYTDATGTVKGGLIDIDFGVGGYDNVAEVMAALVKVDDGYNLALDDGAILHIQTTVPLRDFNFFVG